MKFSYIALGQDNEKVTGTLEASSLEVARKKLHQQELSVLLMKELTKKPKLPEAKARKTTPQQSKTSTIKTFYFLAKRTDGQEVNGTIDSKEAFEAYQRLTEEYEFEVINMKEGEMVEEGTTDGLQPQFKKWNQKLQHQKTKAQETQEAEDEIPPPQILSAPPTPTSFTPSEKPESLALVNEAPEAQEVNFNASQPLFHPTLKLPNLTHPEVDPSTPPQETFKSPRFWIKRDYYDFFLELDSFVGWLIFFYLTYFFLASFSLERGIGLSKELVVKTLSSPLVINICIFLLFTHLALQLKLKFFRKNFLGSAFLFFFFYSAYALLIGNL